jgi:SAM-dependent methyltransferase
MLCPICASSKVNLEFETTDIECRVATGSFRYYRCGYCDVLFMHPIPDRVQIASFYDDTYSVYQDGSTLAKQKSSIKQLIKFFVGFLFMRRTELDIIKKIIALSGLQTSQINIMEYGCGVGNFMSQLSRIYSFRNFVGLDFSQRAVDICNKKGLNVYRADSLSDYVSSVNFDIIYAFQLLEHLPEPKKFIDDVYKKLSKDGYLYLTLPNTSSLGYRLFGRFWKGLDAPRHIFQYNLLAVKRLLGDRFEIVDYKTESFYISSYKLMHGFKYMDPHWSTSGIANIVFRNWFGRLTGLLGLGDNMHILCKRKNS